MKTASSYFRTNWKLILILAVFYLIFELLYVFKVDYFVSLSGQQVPFRVLVAYLIDWLLVTTYMALISIHTSYLLEKRVPWNRIIPLHLFLSILISVVIRLVIDAYQMGIGDIIFEDYTYQNFIEGIVHSIDVNYLIYSAMIFVIYAFYYLQQIKMAEKQKNLLETQLLDTRIKMLTSQLQPHFLFNTLNSISSLIDIDKEKAQDTLADLSDFLRQILSHMSSNFISVQKEIEILNPYLNILRTRFHNRIEIQVNVQENLLQVEIPHLLLQPLIENAVKHGNVSSNSVLLIKLKIYSRSNDLFIEVYNSGKLDLEEKVKYSKGLGLSNLKSRLENIYGNKGKFNMENDNNMVKCTVSFPLDNQPEITKVKSKFFLIA